MHGRTVLFFAAWTDHFSIYPAGNRLPDAFKAELARYEVSRGTIRFPLSKPIPQKLIARIAVFRANEAAANAEAKPKARRSNTSIRPKRAKARKRMVA